MAYRKIRENSRHWKDVSVFLEDMEK